MNKHTVADEMNRLLIEPDTDSRNSVALYINDEEVGEDVLDRLGIDYAAVEPFGIYVVTFGGDSIYFGDSEWYVIDDE